MSSGFPSGTGVAPTVPEEYDSCERQAEVWLYDSEASAFGLTFTYRHWILVFEFVDSSVRAIEDVNYKGKLLPSFTKMKDPGSRKVSRKGIITISPTRIRKLVINNPYNRRAYDVLGCNCQTWLNEILKKLGFDTEITALSEVVWTTASIGLGSLNPALGLCTYGIRQTYNFLYNVIRR